VINYYRNSSSTGGKILRGILYVLLIGIVIGLGFLIVFAFKSGQAQSLAKDTNIALDNQNPVSGLSLWWDKINPMKMETYSSEIDDSEEYQDLGVEIVSFEPTQTVFFEDDSIQAFATVDAVSLSDEVSMLNFNCSLEDYYGESLVLPASRSYYKNTRVSPRCSFEGGKIGLGNTALNTKAMTFSVNFDFVNQAYYNIYVMRKDVYENLVFEKQEDPFDYYDVSDKNLNVMTNVVESRATPGPVNLGLGSVNSQPFFEGTDPNFLQVSLTRNSNNGNIKYVKNLTLKVTPEIVLSNDNKTCDFELYGEEFDEERGIKLYDLYRLTPYAFSERVNIGCTKEELNGTGLSVRSCMNDLKSNIQLQCLFTIPEFPEESVQSDEKVDFVLLSPIIATVDYVYEIERKINVDIRKSRILREEEEVEFVT